MPFQWLIYIHASSAMDKKYAQISLNDLQKNLGKDVSCFVICFGPTKYSNTSLSYLTKHGSKNILLLKNNGIPDVSVNLKTMSENIQSTGMKIDGICFWAHGGTTGLSKWTGWTEPFLPITIAVKHLVEPFKKAKVVCFDSCDQGCMSTLYQLPKHVEVVLASPAFHPFTSILSTLHFADPMKKKLSTRHLSDLKSRNTLNKENLLKFMHNIACEWFSMSKESWRGMLVFDMYYVRKIADLYASFMDELVFDNKSQIEKVDANIHDLFTAARKLPEIQKIISLSVKASCPFCMKRCNKKIHGMSVDAHLPRKWISSYKSSKWYKEIVKGKRGFRLT